MADMRFEGFGIGTGTETFLKCEVQELGSSKVECAGISANLRSESTGIGDNLGF